MASITLQPVGAGSPNVQSQSQPFSHFVQSGDLFFTLVVNDWVMDLNNDFASGGSNVHLYHYDSQGTQKAVTTFAPSATGDELYQLMPMTSDGVNGFFAIEALTVLPSDPPPGNQANATGRTYIVKVSQDLSVSIIEVASWVTVSNVSSSTGDIFGDGRVLAVPTSLIAMPDGSLWIQFSSFANPVLFKLNADLTSAGVSSTIPGLWVLDAAYDDTRILARYISASYTLRLLDPATGTTTDVLTSSTQLFGSDVVPGGEIIIGSGGAFTDNAISFLRDGGAGATHTYWTVSGDGHDDVHPSYPLRLSPSGDTVYSFVSNIHQGPPNGPTTFNLLSVPITGGSASILAAPAIPPPIASALFNSFIVVRLPGGGLPPIVVTAPTFALTI